MELFEYIALRKQKQPNFRQSDFAKKIKISPSRFVGVVKYKLCPSGKQALAIEKETEGLVKGWELILKCLENK